MFQKLTIIQNVHNEKVVCDLSILDTSIIGKEAQIYLHIKCNVKYGDPVDKDQNILIKKQILQPYGNSFEIDLKKYGYYHYNGSFISMKVSIEVKIDDALFFDTKISQKIIDTLHLKPKVLSNAKEIIDPKDIFNFAANLQAIPFSAKVFVIILCIIGACIVGINMIIGIHDQIVPEAQTYFYSHYDSDGDSNSPFFNALLGSGVLGASIWLMIKAQLRKYMTFFLKKIRFNGKRDEKYLVSDIIGGKPRVDLKNVELRIVACNMEKGKYVRGSGTKRRTVSFSEPVRALEIYKKRIDMLPAGKSIAPYFQDQISFEKMYQILYPKQMLGKSHGVDIHWEVQLIHNEFVDQELVGKSHTFNNNYFFEG